MGSMVLAAVSGPCVNCHTMHNSQGGDPMMLGGVTGPLGALVRSSCLGCHTTTLSDPLATPSGGSGLYPFVKSTTAGFNDDNCLAGGFFPADDGTANQGKAHSLGSTAAPPGYNATPDWYTGDTNGLSCAGTNGCHGSQSVLDEMGAIKGGHHAPPTVYRILWAYNNGTVTGVAGIGATDYEKALIAGTSAPPGSYARSAATKARNIYKAGTTNDTVSRLCANCHGQFHSDVGSASPWHRHPTDVKLPNEWTVQLDTLETDVDAKYNPFGFDALVTTGKKYATCLSCHRAHGTANKDLLRFAYLTGDTGTAAIQSAGSGLHYGCLGCHNKQR
ncbi:MAG: cytochrome c3 family protein [Thermodesulfobacteriota bacterium]|nr:cytochrome c3 family protein [Thermodesulfobacteriota bacterium]